MLSDKFKLRVCMGIFLVIVKLLALIDSNMSGPKMGQKKDPVAGPVASTSNVLQPDFSRWHLLCQQSIQDTRVCSWE